jgi:hypothetical protein
MLGLRGTKALGAGRDRFAGGGLTSNRISSNRISRQLPATLFPLAAALLLAACQQPGQLRLAGTSATPVAATKTAAAPKPTPLAATPAVAHGESIVPTAARLTGDPHELLGLDHSAVRRVLGRPAQVRNELTAQVWQYVTGDCVVDLYLYQAEGGGMKVTYVEARSHTAETAPTGRCLKSLLERPTASAE